MVLVEFKQALKDLAKVPTDELPHQQMMRYAAQIEDEKALHLKSRRPIKVSSDARFYMYAVCEISDALLKRLVVTGFTPTPYRRRRILCNQSRTDIASNTFPCRNF